jgi:glucokinase
MISLGIDVGGTAVKIAAVEGHRVLWTGKSTVYERPSTEQVVHALKEAAADRAGDAIMAGICVPGILNDDRSAVKLSVNIPGLMGIPLTDLVRQALADGVRLNVVSSDAVASAYDLQVTRNLKGRLFCLAIGTGIGAAVLDDGKPLKVHGDSPGHFGQMDVSIEGAPVIGPDGGAGGLEGYLGAAALAKKYGNEFYKNFEQIKALVRAIRIGHAIYCPDHVGMVGGIGIRLGHAIDDVYRMTNDHLTKIAKPGWTLAVGDHDHHAAVGAAKMALASWEAGRPRR